MPGEQPRVRLAFVRAPDGFRYARSDTSAGEALAGLLTSDVSSVANAGELVEELRRAEAG